MTSGSDDDVMTEADSSSSSGSDDVSGREVEETDPLILTDTTILECPICCESLRSPVYQCKNGHIACAPCCTKMTNKCPSCRCSVGTIRCRVMEKLIESFTVACENEFYGCKEIFIRNKKLDKLSHEKICRYSPCTCPYNNCTYVGMSESLYNHFGEAHSPSLFSFDTMKSILLGPRQTRVFLQDTDGCTLFVLERTIKSPGSFVSVTCVGPNLPSMAFSYSLIVVDGRAYVHFIADVVCVQKWTAGCHLGNYLVLPSNMVNESGKLSLILNIRRE